MAITDDFVIISGDSRGTTSFWDGKIGTLLEEVNAHKAAVLCLCLSEDQQTVYSAGEEFFLSFHGCRSENLDNKIESSKTCRHPTSCWPIVETE